MSDNTPPQNPYAPPETMIVNAGGDLAPASRWRRLGGSLIDTVVLLVALIPLMIIYYGGFEAYSKVEDTGGFLFELGFALVAFVVDIIINGYLMAYRGQSIGKWVVGTQIVRSDGSKADFVRLAFIRYLPYSIVYVIPFVGYPISIINVLLIFRESRKCGHDEIADTIVVNAQK